MNSNEPASPGTHLRIRITPAFAAAIGQAAESEMLSVSAFVRRAVKDAITRMPHTTPASSPSVFLVDSGLG